MHGGSAADGSTLSDAATFEFSTCRWTEVLLSNPEAPAGYLHTKVRSLQPFPDLSPDFGPESDALRDELWYRAYR